MAKIKITKEQAIMLENLNKKKVIKITEAQYKRLIESLNPGEKINRAFETAMPPSIRKDFTKYRKELSEGLWESFVNELYGLNESSEKVYETLIKVMEACGYVENRKLSKTRFGGDKEKAKDVILGGLQTLHETGSPFMAMEAIEEAFKSEKTNPIFKPMVDGWFAKGNENAQVKKYYDKGEYWLAWKIARNLGDVGKAPQNPQDMEIVQSKMTEEESDAETPTKMVPINPEVEDEVDTITMDVPLFIRALEYSREDAQSDMDLHDIAQNAIVLSKEYGTLNMDNYSDIFGDAEEVEAQPTGEEPINEAMIWSNEEKSNAPGFVAGEDILNYIPFVNLPETGSDEDVIKKSTELFYKWSGKNPGDELTSEDKLTIEYIPKLYFKLISLPQIGETGSGRITNTKERVREYIADYKNYETYDVEKGEKIKPFLGKEPIFTDIKFTNDANVVCAKIANKDYFDYMTKDSERHHKLMAAYFKSEKEAGRTSGLDEIEIGESGTVASSSGSYVGARFLQPMKNESKIQEALNALKKK